MESAKIDLAKEWDRMADMYASVCNFGTMQVNTVLFNATMAKNAKAIWEVGIGPGLSSIAFVTTFMQKGAVYYNSDISEEMIRQFERLYKESELVDSPKVTFETIEKDTKIESIASSDDSVKKIFATVANNEELPYPDEVFDLYMANLSLMIVHEPEKMLSEAYRVTKKGGKVGFTVIGRPENQIFWTVIPAALKTVADLPQMPKPKTQFGDIQFMKSKLEEHGFKCSKLFYVPLNWFSSTEEAFNFSISTPLFHKVYESLDEAQKEKAKQAYFEIWEEKFGAESITPASVEILVVIAEK